MKILKGDKDWKRYGDAYWSVPPEDLELEYTTVYNNIVDFIDLYSPISYHHLHVSSGHDPGWTASVARGSHGCCGALNESCQDEEVAGCGREVRGPRCPWSL